MLAHYFDARRVGVHVAGATPQPTPGRGPGGWRSDRDRARRFRHRFWWGYAAGVASVVLMLLIGR